ncbi:MarR family winged helix-turn-helix transcriptional regulator [Roseibium salinum]|uniref:MarR family winged helix-turn-helix transcriptional regulator n=1 Tax=Roseibium salinum TaxID=1604349 RepID=UPI0036106B07
MSEKTDPREPSRLLSDAQAPDPGAELDDFLCFAVYEANLAFNHIYRSLLEDLGLTYPQYLVMTLLWRRNGRTVKEFGDALSLEYNTVTPLIKRLETMGLVDRIRDREDQRVVKVTLTPQGSALEERQGPFPTVSRKHPVSQGKRSTT